MQRGPSLMHRYESYMNYSNLFSEILRTKQIDDEPVPNIPVDIQLVSFIKTSKVKYFLAEHLALGHH